MAYDLGNEELNERLRSLVNDSSDNDNQDLIEELVVTALKLHRDGASRSDLKLINTALKEMRYSNLVFSRHDEPKVTIYGSARTGRDDPNYLLTEEFAATMASHGWGVITGAGPGIMEAGNKGAGIENSYGVNIRLPFEASANEFIADGRTVNFKYFFTRKLGFVKESHAFVIMPGGFGTLDEAFELITLIQTGKSDLHPIVLLEAEGTGYWDPLLEFIRETVLSKGMISESDLSLFLHTTDPQVACDHILEFYTNYHSQRFTAGRLILRVRQPPTDEELEALNDEFADIVVEGRIERTEPNQSEIEDGDALDKDRITFYFDRRHFGRLRQLIDRLNALASLPETTEIPSPITEEQAERPW
ncbi:MAG TPA: TIGR00730 family Rossman fold protein [Acidimicrobiia bacterium]|nr:TIGR00730 family Rossman fold protein [Acidimicrobiia bacterium]